MLHFQILIGVFVLSVLAIGLVVVARLLWCAYRALNASRFRLAALAVMGIAGLAGLFVVVAAVWLGYGVSHSRKDGWSDLQIMLLTGLPFYGASYGLWRLARSIQSEIGKGAAPAGDEGDAPGSTRR
jgi:hypothetical protein